ncbi:MAG: sulfatase [Polyangia bacterium]
MRSYWKGIVFSIAALSLVACGGDGGENAEPKRETKAAADRRVASGDAGERSPAGKAEKQQRAETAGEKAKQDPPSVPDAYFGELPWESVEEPIRVEDRERDSVVLLVADALNVRHLGIYGYERPTSPELERLANRGTVFTGHVSNSSWTRPSFTTIVTGLPKKRHHVELEGPPLVFDIETLAERFLKEGYRTAGIVGNPLIREVWGYAQGFQYWEDIKTMEVRGFPPDEILMDRALRWLESTGDEPFFLVMFLTAPHPPYKPLPKARRFLEKVPEGDYNAHPFKEYTEPMPREEHLRVVAAYDDEVAYMDRQIGRLLDFLERNDRDGDTSIIFTADHGELFGQHGCYLHAYHMWEQALRVPLVIASPRLPARGTLEDRSTTHVDLAPTALELAGLERPSRDELPGKSLLRLLAEPEGHRPRVLFSQYTAHGVRRQAIRKEGLKLVHHHRVESRTETDLNELHPHLEDRPDPRELPSLAWDGERYELYDLIRDPGEERDLFSRRRESPELLELTAALRKRIAGGEDGAPGKLSQELIEALEAAGYLRRADESEASSEEKKKSETDEDESEEPERS